MPENTYTISLRIKGDHFAPDLVSASLGLPAQWKQKMGEQRRAPNGQCLDGFYETNYSSFLLCRKERGLLSEYLEKNLYQLESKKDTLNQVTKSGNSVELFIGWYGENHIGDILSGQLLSRLGALGISLSLDIYIE